jgi:histidinol phosphatase-like enzyme
MKLGVFIERDGVLNLVKVERQHQVLPSTVEELQPNHAAVPLLEKLKNAGLILNRHTNQPGISRGYQNRRELDSNARAAAQALSNWTISWFVPTTKPIGVHAANRNRDCWSKRPSNGIWTSTGPFVISDKWRDRRSGARPRLHLAAHPFPFVGKVHRDFVLSDLERGCRKEFCA